MKIENQDLIEEFYEKVKDEFPSITIEDTKDICFTPWRFLKQQMESGELPEVRFKYFSASPQSPLFILMFASIDPIARTLFLCRTPFSFLEFLGAEITPQKLVAQFFDSIFLLTILYICHLI